ncbi:MAG: phytanoyl-CoA dioxygenase family protein [Cyanobacteria bacterium J06592_8]
MQLSSEQLQTYQDLGYLLVPNCFSEAEIDRMRTELRTIYAQETPRKIIEGNENQIRTVLGVHTENEIFRRCSHHASIIEPIMQILGSKIYIHQSQINPKIAWKNDVWIWHQDYVFFHKEDGIPTPQLVIALVFLYEVNEFNGPLMLIPGSHKKGIVSVLNPVTDSETDESEEEWHRHIKTNQTYHVDRETFEKLVNQYGIVAPKGKAGSVLFMHPNCVHGSSSNMSPFDRALFAIRYNSVKNLPLPVENPRPDFQASRDYTPIEPLSGEVLSV